MKQYLNIILGSLFISLLTNCAPRPYFAVENKSNHELKIELILDTARINIYEIVAEYIFERTTNNKSCKGTIQCDSIIKALQLNENKGLMYKYLYDSLPIRSFFIPNDPEVVNGLEEYQINPLELSEKDFDNGNFNVNLNQTLFDYYHWDSLFVKKIINANTITLFVPPNNMFSKQCTAKAESRCSVEGAFPDVKELRIVIAADNVITLTKQNFKIITRNKAVQGQSESYVLEIK
jgi:hypothetical protein